jgi:osmotically-inducible protein OsmY
MAARPPITPGLAGVAGDSLSPHRDGRRSIEAAAKADLWHSPYPELRRVTCEYYEGILTLRGHVSSYYMKQIAQTIVQHVEGVERVVNRVEVVRGPLAR